MKHGARGCGRWVGATVHPSSLLRAPDPQTRRVETERFIADLKVIGRLLAEQD
jgi:DNA polymerase